VSQLHFEFRNCFGFRISDLLTIGRRAPRAPSARRRDRAGLSIHV
jgi:hypothetical protein